MKSSGGLHRKPYHSRENTVAPTLTSISPTTTASGTGTVAMTLTGTFDANSGQFQAIFDGTPFACAFVSGTSLTSTITKTGKVAGAYLIKVVDALGRVTVTQTLTIT